MASIEVGPAMLIALASIAFVAGIFDAIAGGGGLITLPALFLCGVPPVTAIATNKLQAASATVSATLAYSRRGLIEWRLGYRIAVMAFAGGVSGALCVKYFPTSLIEAVVPYLLVAVAVYFAFPRKSQNNKPSRVSLSTYASFVAPFLGFYDGVFGPGVGSFFMATIVGLVGFDLMRAMSMSKLANASSNIGALLVFAAGGQVIWTIAVVMAVASYMGAQVGSKLATRVGPKLVRPLIVAVSCLMAAKLAGILPSQREHRIDEH